MATGESTAGTGPAQTLPADGEHDGPGAPQGLQAQTPRLQQGAQVGRYVVLRELGRGGMGVVYSAYDPELDRRVAIKLLHGDDRSDRTHQHNRRLVREAQTLARLNHPNVITVHDVGTWSHCVFIAMEYVEGGTLRQWLDRGRHPWPEVVARLAAAGRGLQAAHDVGLVHRDFKPENVLLGTGPEPRVLVADFGLARAVGEVVADPERTLDDGTPLPRSLVGAELTMTGALLGTPVYMAPEQHMGRPPDRRTDQFAFALVSWEALFGQRAFAGKTAAELACTVTTGAITPPPSRAGVPRAIHAALRRALSVDPEQRFGDLRDLLAALERTQGGGRRRTVVVALATATVVASAAALLGRSAPPCEGGPEALAPVWSPGRANALRDAFVGTGAPYAEATFDLVRAQLDTRAQAWLESHREACEATRVRGEQSEAALDLRMQCLRRRARELDAALEVMQDADAEVVRNAVDAAHRLPQIESCNDLDALQSALPPPSDDDARTRLGDFEARLARADALRHAGKYDDARDLVEAQRSAAEDLDRADVDAEFSLALARTLQPLGQGEPALTSAKRAVWTAHAARLDELEFSAAITVLAIIADELRKPELAGDWVELARATASRMGNPPTRMAELEHRIAGLHFRAGDYQLALEANDRALALVERADDDPMLVTLQAQRASILLDLGRTAEGIAANRGVLALRERTLGREHPHTARAHNNLGNAMLNAGDRKAAIDEYTAALDIWTRSLGTEHTDVAMAHMNLANALAESGGAVAARALPHYERAIAIWTRLHGPDDVRVGVGLSNLARYQLFNDRVAEALAALERSIEISERTQGPEHPDLVYPLLNVSDAQTSLGNFTAAAEASARALVIARSAFEGSHPMIARAQAMHATALLHGQQRRVDAKLGVEHAVLDAAVAELEDAMAMQTELVVRNDELGLTKYALAQALLIGGGDRVRVRTLAQEAVVLFAADPYQREQTQAFVDRL